jgi:hypothetical protein
MPENVEAKKVSENLCKKKERGQAATKTFETQRKRGRREEVFST